MRSMDFFICLKILKLLFFGEHTGHISNFFGARVSLTGCENKVGTIRDHHDDLYFRRRGHLMSPFSGNDELESSS
jgi:hypothetical protein